MENLKWGIAKVKVAPQEARGADDGYDIEVVCSTDAIDRAGEVIEQSGWQLDRFKDNPVFLAAHDHRLANGSSPVIGSFVSIEIVSDQLIGRVRFADTDLGREYKSLYLDKHMRAVSVGFMSHAFEHRTVDGDKVGVHTEIELYEVSAVAVGCNQEALSRLRKLGYDGGEELAGLKADVAAMKATLDTVIAGIDDMKGAQAVIVDRLAEIQEDQLLLPDSDDDTSAGRAPPADDGSTSPGDGDRGADAADDEATARTADAAKSLLETCRQ